MAAQPPKRRGCFFYGCLTCIVLFLIACVLIFLGIRYVKNKINGYTDAVPVKFPKVEMTDADFKKLEARVKTFGEALDQGKAIEPLILTELDINALLVKSGNAKELAEKVHVSLNGSEIKGQVSIPLSGFGWFTRNRYLNGEATFTVSLENGVLNVKTHDIQVKGRTLPESLMGALRQENLAKDVANEPKNAEAIRKFESIQVQDSRVIVKARPPPAPAAPAPEVK
ncbi:MAG: hypothetical protein EXS35_16735 [Pedosphaera sp.]|nr:hypothetical protein [Pedosphaera sp.]